MIPGLAENSLVLVVKSYNAGCKVLTMKIWGHPPMTINCRKFTKSGLWMIPIASDSINDVSQPSQDEDTD